MKMEENHAMDIHCPLLPPHTRMRASLSEPSRKAAVAGAVLFAAVTVCLSLPAGYGSDGLKCLPNRTPSAQAQAAQDHMDMLPLGAMACS